MRRPPLLACIIALVVAAAIGCETPSPPGTQGLTNHVVDWRDEVIYQVLVDRFANGDASNDYHVDLDDPTAYHGGDWRGLAGRLDYLEELGVTTLWISPVVKNVEADSGFSSYHGYWTQDFTRPNPHFGDVTALRELVDAAHARGFKVVLDIVTNHVGQAFFYDINKNGQGDEFFMGQGGVIVPLGQGQPSSDLVHVLEWDPDFDRRGVQSWTSLGPSGEAPIVWAWDPANNRVPPYPEIFAREASYNRKGRVTVWTHPEVCSCPSWGCAWDDPCRREQEVLGDFPGGLKDLATERQDVRDALFEVFARWIEVGNFDGFRIDTLKHVEMGFWDDFCSRIRAFATEHGKDNFLMFGEAFDGDDRLLGSYTQGQGVDSVFNFSGYYGVVRGALLGDGARTCEIARHVCRRHGCAADPCGEGESFDALYSDTGKNGGPVGADGLPLDSRQLTVNFLSNHDVGRLLYFMPEDWSPTVKRQVLHLALVYLMTAEGIPCLYYGVEQEFAGGNDPANRETMWAQESYLQRYWDGSGWQVARRSYVAESGATVEWRPWDTGNPTFRWIKRLNALRKSHVALRRGDMLPVYVTNDAGTEDHGIFAFERRHPDETALIVLNLGADAEAHTGRAGATMPVDFPPGTVLIDQLDPAGTAFAVASSGCTAPAGGGCLDVTVPPRTARLLTP